MSLVSDAMANALGVLATGTAQALEYRVGISGSWTALSGAFLQPGPPEAMAFDDGRGLVMAPARARLEVPRTGPRLVAGTIAKPGAQVRHTVGASVTEWAIVGAAHTDGQSIYELARALPSVAGDVRGGL